MVFVLGRLFRCQATYYPTRKEVTTLLTIPFQQIPFELWKPIHVRKGIHNTFKPVFTRYIGVEKQDRYDDILATISDAIKNDPEHNLLFDNQIPMTADFSFINAIKYELSQMNMTKLASQDITLFQNPTLNQRFLSACETIVTLAFRQEAFPNDSIKANFVCKLLLYAHLHLQTLDYTNTAYQANHCFYYGEISRQDIYFLKLLHLLNFDVVYINPLKDVPEWPSIDTDATLHKNTQLLPIESFQSRAQKGQAMQESQSLTLTLEQNLTTDFLNQAGVYQPWQFRHGTTEPVFFNGSLIDLEQNWYQAAKFRQGFKTHQSTVYVPHFFFEIEGEHRNKKDYLTLVDNCRKAPNTLVFTQDTPFTNPLENPSDRFKLAFCQYSNGRFDPEKLKQLPFYTYGPYNDATENFMLGKINDILTNTHLFKEPLTKKEDIFDFVLMALTLTQPLVRCIDSFDFTDSLPKLMIVVEGDAHLTKAHSYLIAYLNQIGFDILILSPAGLSDLSTFFQAESFNSVRLDQIVYDQTLVALKPPKQSLFSKLFS
mgnify:FL=1